MIKVALDAMGGDHAPHEIIKGALSAIKEYPVEIILVGDPEAIKKHLPHQLPDKISIFPASQKIEMNESPALAVKQKRDASVNIAVKLVKEQKADAVISAGNTGALMAAALFGLGRIKGIERPAIATIFPTPSGRVLLLDMGANVDCKPENLRQFALMGAAYAEKVLHIKNPRIGLLNIGEEAEKGNELVVSSYPLLKNLPINFAGNVESKEIFSDKVDVVVCDGFVGNLILKFAESVASTIVTLLKKEVKKTPLTLLGALMLVPAFKNLKKMVDYDEYGGAQLLGVKGICFKAHGRARAKAIKNTIRVAWEAVEGKLVDAISEVKT